MGLHLSKLAAKTIVCLNWQTGDMGSELVEFPREETLYAASYKIRSVCWLLSEEGMVVVGGKFKQHTGNSSLR